MLYNLRLKQQLIKEKGFTLQFLSEPACSSQLDYVEVACSLLESARTRVSVLSFLRNFYAVANQGIGLYSQNFYHNQRVVRSSIYIRDLSEISRGGGEVEIFR